MAYIFRTTGEIEKIEITKDNFLKQMQDIVGGYIERVPLFTGGYLICNEEGKITNLPVNSHGTLLYNIVPKKNAIKKGIVNFVDIIVGDCIVLSEEEFIEEEEE